MRVKNQTMTRLDEIIPVQKKRRLQITATPVVQAVVTTSSTPTRFQDGLYADRHACERKKKLKVVNCPCETSRRAALSKLIARKETNADDPTYKKFHEFIAAEVYKFDNPAVDETHQRQCSVITFACPHCAEDLEVLCCWKCCGK